MKKLFTLLFILTSLLTFAQTYTISNWYNDKQSATVLTFDDWDPASPGSSVPTMISKSLVGTFFVTINNAWRVTDYPDMTNAASKGIEIANHTISHPSLISAGNYVTEIENCRTTLNANVTQDLPVHTFAYPYGDYNASVITEVKKHHVAARAVSYTENAWGYNYPSTNNQYFTIPTIQVGTMGTIEDFTAELDAAITGGGLYTIMYHSVGGLGWFDDIPQALFEDQLDEVKARENSTWVTTFSNATRYHKEKHCASLTTLSDDATTWTLELTDTLSNNTIFSHPLSIKLSTPPGQLYTNVQQNGLDIAFNASATTLSFNAVPDGGDIVLSKGAFVPTSTLQALEQNILLYPSPASDEIHIKTSDGIDVTSINIMTMQGQTVYSQENFQDDAISISQLPTGVYVVEIITQHTDRILKKIIKQ